MVTFLKIIERMYPVVKCMLDDMCDESGIIFLFPYLNLIANIFQFLEYTVEHNTNGAGGRLTFSPAHPPAGVICTW